MNGMSFSEFNRKHGEMRDRGTKDDPEGFEITQTCFSDYSGSVVEMSNFYVLYKEINDLFPDTEGFVELYGSFGSSLGLGYIPALLTIEEAEYIRDVLDNLENYPVLDDEHMSEIERDILEEHFRENVESELRKYLESESVVPIVVEDVDVDQAIKYMFCYATNNGFAFTETGGAPYIDWSNLFKSYKDECKNMLDLFTKWELLE